MDWVVASTILRKDISESKAGTTIMMITDHIVLDAHGKDSAVGIRIVTVGIVTKC